MAARLFERAAAVVAAALLIIGLVSAPERRAADTLSIVTYGACTACTATENRVAIQAAIDAAVSGDTIYIPPGTYYVNKVPTSGPWSLYISGKSLIFAGESRDTSIIALDPIQANQDVPFGNHLGVFYLKDIAGVTTFRDFQIEGSKDNPDGPTEYEEPPEHHRGIFVWNSDGLLVEDMLIENFTGDALQLYIEADNTTVRRSIFRWNQRDGLTLSPAPNEQLTGVLAEYNEFYGNSNQQVDNEHGAAHNIVLRYNTFSFADNENSIGLAIAGAGTDGSDPSTNWNVHNNTISGGIRFTWTSYSRIADNVINNPREISAIELERVQTDNEVSGNTITVTQSAVANLAGVYLNGTIGGGASNITIEDNTITVSNHSQSFGVRADGVVSLTVRGNTLYGPGVAAAGYFGTRVRTTVPERLVESVVITNNRFRGWGEGGVGFFGGSVTDTGRILSSTITGNWCEHGGSMAECIDLDNSQGPAEIVILGMNVRGCGVSSLVVDTTPAMDLRGSPLNQSIPCP